MDKTSERKHDLVCDHNNMVKTVFLLMFCYFYLGCDVCGQRACGEDSNVLDSCDGRVISNDNLYVDFGVIKSQCSCSFTKTHNAELIYSLSRNPDYNYDGCGTAIQIKEINGVTSKMSCASSTPHTVLSSLSTTVELVYIEPTYMGNTRYCLRVLSNNASVIVKGSCQSIPLPPSSSKTIITSTQSGQTNSPQSVPTYSTLSDPTNSTQRSINQKDDITNAPIILFFRNLLFSFDLSPNKKN